MHSFPSLVAAFDLDLGLDLDLDPDLQPRLPRDASLEQNLPYTSCRCRLAAAAAAAPAAAAAVAAQEQKIEICSAFQSYRYVASTIVVHPFPVLDNDRSHFDDA